MEHEAYVHGQHWAHTLALLSERVPAAEMLQEINRTESIAPFTDPTLYHRGLDRLAIVKRYLEATAHWQVAARAFLADWERTEPAAARAREALSKDATQHPGAAAGSIPPLGAAERN